jgi:Mg/Co/Ni transporter MgtE
MGGSRPRRIFGAEIATGGLIGRALALLAFFESASVLGISLFAAGTLASFIGLLLPWMLSRVKH